MNRPTFVVVVAALRTTDPRFPWVGPADDEDDAAAALEVTEETHRGTSDEEDEAGHWGRCSRCDLPWPCPTWVDAEHLAVQYLGRAAGRLRPPAKPVTDGFAARDPAPVGTPDLDAASYGVLGDSAGLAAASPGRHGWAETVSHTELLRRRYPPTGDVGLWVRHGPDGPPAEEQAPRPPPTGTSTTLRGRRPAGHPTTTTDTTDTTGSEPHE